MSGKKLLAVMAALMLIMAACGDDDDASSTATTVSDEVDTPQLTWGGTDSDLVGKEADDLPGDCTYAGPAEVTEGVVVVEFVNTSDDNAGLVVFKIDEGYTADDVAEYWADPSVAAFPPWANTDMGSGGVAGAEAGETIAWEAVLDAGEYALLCGQRRVRAQPWFGSGLTVGGHVGDSGLVGRGALCAPSKSVPVISG